MSQVVKILGIKVTGSVYLGIRDDAAYWSRKPAEVMEWMSDGWRHRFNQHRSNRSKYEYGHDGEEEADEYGRVLVPIGATVTTLSDKEARQAYSHLEALPMQVIQSAARIENTEWFAAAKRRKTLMGKGVKAGKMPRFMSRKHADKRFTCWHNSGRNATFQRCGKRSGILTIRGMNPPGKRAPDGTSFWQIKIRVRLSESIRPYTSVHVNLTRNQVAFTSPPPNRITALAPKDSKVGLDMGVAKTIATSNGEFHSLPDIKDLTAQIASAQRKMTKSRIVAEKQGRDFKNSNRYQARKTQAAKLQAKAARIRQNWAHQVANQLVTSNELLVIEDLKIRNMTRKGKGSRKRGLNRSMQNSSLARLRETLEYKAEANGRTCVAVPAHYTSQRCHKCGYTAKENRESQAEFQCQKCGHTHNADINAAHNILDRYLNPGAWTTASQQGAPLDQDQPRSDLARAKNCKPPIKLPTQAA